MIAEVLSHEHSLGDVPLTVEPYYSWLGCSSSSAARTCQTDRPHTDSHIVDFVSVTCEQKKLDYVLRIPAVKADIETRLERDGCMVTWPESRGGPIELKLIKTSDQKRPVQDWAKNCKSLLMELLSEIRCETVSVLQELWNSFKTEVDGHIRSHDYVMYKFDDDSCSLSFTGRRDASDQLMTVVDGIKMSLEEELIKKREEISETITSLSHHQLMILSLCNYADELTTAIKGVKVDITDNEVHLAGLTNDVKNAKIKLYEKLTHLLSATVTVLEAQAELMEKDCVKSHLLECFRRLQVLASWSVRDTELSVFAFNKDQLSSATDVILSTFDVKELPLDSASQLLLSKQKWKSFEQQLIVEHKMVVLDKTKEGFLVLWCTNECFGAVQEKVQNFIDKNSLVSKLVPLMRPMADLLGQYMSSDLEKIGADLTHSGGHIKRIDGSGEPGFKLVGSRSAVESAAGDLVRLTEFLAMYDHEIDRPGVPAYLMSTAGAAILSDLQRKHHVIIELESGVARGCTSAADSTASVAVVKYSRKVLDSNCLLLLFVLICFFPKYFIYAPGEVNIVEERLNHWQCSQAWSTL